MINPFRHLGHEKVRKGGGWGFIPPQIFAIVGLLPIDKDSEKKKSIVRTYKPLKIP